LRVPLSQPDFLLGAVFVLFILFAPGGIAGLTGRVASRVSRVRARKPQADPGRGPVE
jgi:branched-chain amino acid transport system permease protein